MSGRPWSRVLRGLALMALAFALWGAEAATARDTGPQGGSEAAPALAAPRDLGVEEAAALLADPPEGLIILDVRTPQEFREGHLAGARNMDFFGPGFERDAAALPADAPLLLYCRSGRRSAAAARALAETGHTRVFNLGGGIEAWKKAGLSLVQ